MYSRHCGGFLARSVLSRILLDSGRQLPHFVFILCVKNRSTLTPMCGSHLAINEGTTCLSCSRYHSSRMACFFSLLAPGRTCRCILLCLSSTVGASSLSATRGGTVFPSRNG